MNKGKLLFGIALLMVASFGVGRLTAPPPENCYTVDEVIE